MVFLDMYMHYKTKECAILGLRLRQAYLKRINYGKFMSADIVTLRLIAWGSPLKHISSFKKDWKSLFTIFNRNIIYFQLIQVKSLYSLIHLKC